MFSLKIIIKDSSLVRRYCPITILNRHIVRLKRPGEEKQKIEIVKNEDIKFPEIRVVFKNEGGKDEHKIMKRIEVIID